MCRPGRPRLIHMQMWGGAGAKKKRGNESEREQLRKKKERETGTACSEWQDRLLFLQHRALHWKGRLLKCEHPCRQRRGERQKRSMGWLQQALRHTMRKMEENNEGLSLHLCFSFSRIAVLTLVEFTQAAWVAEGADRPRLPAAAALHPTLCRPDPTPRSLRRNAALCHYIIPARGGRDSDFPCSALHRARTHMHAQSHTNTQHRDREAMRSPPLEFPISPPALLPIFCYGNTHALWKHTFTKLGTFTILLHMLLSVQCRVEERGGREWVKQRGEPLAASSHILY